jgi:DNA-binding NtrC family response regulator
MDTQSPLMQLCISQMFGLSKMNSPLCVLGNQGVGKRTWARKFLTHARVSNDCIRFADARKLDARHMRAFLQPVEVFAPPVKQFGLIIHHFEMLPHELQELCISHYFVSQTGPHRLKHKHTMRVVLTLGSPLEQAVTEGLLHPGTAKLLQSATVQLPDLADRREDILLLLQAIAKSHGQQIHVTPKEWRLIHEHAFRENITELKRLAHQFFLQNNRSPSRLKEMMQHRPLAIPQQVLINVAGRSWKDLEGELIQTCLEYFEGNKKRTAEALGLSRSGLYSKLKRTGT